jgi:hypothetical protein
MMEVPMRLFTVICCLLFASPAFAQDTVELTAPAVAEVSPDGMVTVSEPAAQPVAAEPAPVEVEPVPADDSPTVDASTDAAASPAIINDAPSTSQDVVDAGKKVADAWYTKSFPAIAGAVIFLLLTLFRLPALGALTTKIPTRVRVLAVVGLSLLAAVLDAVALGAPWGQALWGVLASSSTAVFANELIRESILGKRSQKVASSQS